MRNATLTLLLFFAIIGCQKKESILETEKKALNSVFNEVIDSVYYRLTNDKISLNNKSKKTIVVNDSLYPESPGYVQFRDHFKNVENLYFDTISKKIRQKIDLNLFTKEAKFKYQYLSSIKQNPIREDFWNSKYALPGFLVFSKINFDEHKKYGVLYCSFTNGDIYKAKWFLIYIKKSGRDWELDEIHAQRRMY
ncbi:hypothetical protein [Flavobacterium proteolyticum]|uniref:DUF3828 domain-containing protein n=1 Tax=Flavobacterium proteolyticum TaxID=2911683 RepID=A0ABR9WV66_9FLAO|nr:hypothetical protein [Flavobacterium proteolyticum]MBE9577568.1 hypothetical protein [Flavobacterium proteolyticum]